MYVVLSFDFGGNSDVRLHCVSVDGLKAQRIYDSVCEQYRDYNEKYNKHSVRKLVDLIKVPDELEWEEGVLAFWGRPSLPGVQRIASNN